jgi:hypothetical protein
LIWATATDDEDDQWLPPSTGVTLFPGVESGGNVHRDHGEYDRSWGRSFIDIQKDLDRVAEPGRIEYRDPRGLHQDPDEREQFHGQVVCHYDDVDNAQDHLDEGAQFGQIVGTQMYSFHEMTNSGKQQIIDLVQNKYDVLQESMTNKVATDLLGSQVADGRLFDGLGRIVTQGGSCMGSIRPTSPSPGPPATGSRS